MIDMRDNRLKVEVFSAPGCNKCRKAFQLTQQVLTELAIEPFDLRQVNIVDELDYAVDLGVLATPSIAINGVLVFTGMPGEAALREAIQSQLAKQDIP